MLGIRLSRLPLSAKIFCTLYLVGIGCGAIAAFVQAATAIGLSPADERTSFAPAKGVAVSASRRPRPASVGRERDQPR